MFNAQNAAGSSPLSSSMKRVITSCMIGNALEWYDFALYIYFGNIIGRLFFPSADPHMERMMTYGVFAAGFIARPIGAVIFGYIGDRWGRKTALLLSIYLMAIPTALIGMLPTYETIGVWAGILMTLLRISQGLALGGEFTGSMVFLVEHAKKEKQNFAGSFAPFSLALGFCLGSLTATVIIKALSTSALETWGWRLPFIISLAGTLVGTYIRRQLSDPKVFLDFKNARKKDAVSIWSLLKEQKFNLGLVLWIDVLTAIGYYLLTSFLPNYMTEYLGYSKNMGFTMSNIHIVVLAISILAGGWLADRVGQRRIMLFGAVSMALLSYPLFSLLIASGQSSPIIGGLTISLIFVSFGLFFGPIPAALCNLFPTPIRFTGLALSHNLAMAICGGTAPLLAFHFMKIYNSYTVPATLLTGAALISAAGVLFLPQDAKKAVSKIKKSKRALVPSSQFAATN